MSADTRLRVMVVDDHPIARVELTVLEQSNEFEVVGQAGDGEGAARVAAEVLPDVVVMDVVMPSQSPFATPSTVSSTSRGWSRCKVWFSRPSRADCWTTRSETGGGWHTAKPSHGNGSERSRWPSSSAPVPLARRVDGVGHLACGSHEHLAASDMANAPTVQGICYLFAAGWGRDDAGTLAGRGAARCAPVTPPGFIQVVGETGRLPLLGASSATSAGRCAT